MADPLLLLIIAGITGVTPLVVAVVPLARKRVSERTTHIMLGVSAGILVSLALVALLPEGFELGAKGGIPLHFVGIAAIAGFLGLFLLERGIVSVGRGTGHAHFENGRKIAPFGTLAISALAIHGLLDGFVVPLALSAGAEVGLIVTAAIALHQVPDSFAAASIALATTRSRRAAFGFVLVTAIDTPLGIGIGTLFLTAGQSLLPFGLAFSAGTFLFVSAADLIPEIQHRARSLLVTLSILAGVVVVAILSLLLPR